MDYQLIDQHWLQAALDLAWQQRGFCAPNPAVGAVVVKGEKLLGSGYHLGPGTPHAEVMALADLGEAAKGSTVYVSLEPCCHYGRTPPCTELLINSQVARVVFGFSDPNPLVAGRGQAALQAAGINCEQLSWPAINDFYAPYAYWHRTGLPWVTAKLALSLDGKIAGPQGEPMAITGPEAKAFTHQGRFHADAILTTVATILADDPLMNARIASRDYGKPVYLLDSQLRLPLTARLLKGAKAVTVFHDVNIAEAQRAVFTANGIQCQGIASDAQGLAWDDILLTIGEAGVHHLWVEAGGTCFNQLVKERRLQQAYLYVAPQVLGANAWPAFTEAGDIGAADSVSWQSLGRDGCCHLQWKV